MQARSEIAPRAKPAWKQVGGKTQLLPELREFLPASWHKYHEVFAGGAALFFDLRAQRGDFPATLCDKNEYFVVTYRALRDQIDIVLDFLHGHERNYLSANPEGRLRYYLSLREAMGTPGNMGPDANEAARFLAVNRTCFNGLFRVNKSGKFNVPMGRYKNPTLCDEANLRACSIALQNTEIVHGDFIDVMTRARAGDLVYADPPYVPVSSTSDFTSYTQDGFTLEDQKRLRDAAFLLKQRGVHVVLSNADVPVVRYLYKDFTIRQVMAKRNINSDPDKRGSVAEVIIT